MSVYHYPMGAGRQWLDSILYTNTWTEIQLWSAIFVLYASVFQLHIGRKFRWPPEPGQITVFFYWLGIAIKQPYWAFRLGDAGSLFDLFMIFVGRAGIALQAFVALIAMDDALSTPDSARSMIAVSLVSVVMIQMRALTAYSPRNESLSSGRLFRNAR